MTQDKNGVIEIDLLQVLEAFLKKAWLIILCMVVCGVGAFCYAYYCITPTYQSSVLFYVNNNNSFSSLDTAKLSISSQDITASKDLVETYIVILKTRNTLDEVIERSGLDLTFSKLNGMISAGAVNETEVFKVVVTDTDPLRAEVIANTIAEVLPDKIASIVEGSSARVVDYAVIPTAKSAPSLTKYTTYGLIIGAVIAIIIILLMLFSDYQIHNEDYLIDTYDDIPLLGVIPDFDVRRSYGRYIGGRKYGYGRGSYNHYYYEVTDKSKSAGKDEGAQDDSTTDTASTNA